MLGSPSARPGAQGGGWLMCSTLTRVPQLQLEPGEADVPSCNFPLPGPAVTDGGQPAVWAQQEGSFHPSLSLLASTRVQSGEPDPECVHARVF